MVEEVGEMTGQERQSVLAERIAAGKADPISAEERKIVAGLQNFHAKKYGFSKASRNFAAATSSGNRKSAKSTKS